MSTEPPDDLSCLTTLGVGRPGDGAVARAVDQGHPDAHSESMRGFADSSTDLCAEGGGGVTRHCLSSFIPLCPFPPAPLPQPPSLRRSAPVTVYGNGVERATVCMWTGSSGFAVSGGHRGGLNGTVVLTHAQGCIRPAVHRRRRGGTPPGPSPPNPPPPLRMFEADSQNFASAPSAPRGFELKSFRPAFGGDHRGTLGGGGSQPNPPPPPSDPIDLYRIDDPQVFSTLAQ